MTKGRLFIKCYRAGRAGEVPVGAVVIDAAHRIVGEGENRRLRDRDPSAHAELVAIREACHRADNWYNS